MIQTVRTRGISASPGIAIARARVIDRGKIKVPKRRVSSEMAESEVERLQSAVEESRSQLMAAHKAIKNSSTGVMSGGDHSLIIEGHLLMLDDELLIKGTVSLILDELINAEWALSRRTDEIAKRLRELGDDYFRERTDDIKFVGNRLLRNLMGHVTEIVDPQGEPCIIVAENLSPAETTQMVGAPVVGFATEGGTRTSHTAIMAQALGIPAVVGVDKITERVAVGDRIIVDGNEGNVIVRPDEATLADYRKRAARYAEFEKKLLATRDDEAVTSDGVKMSLMANIEFPAEAAMALDYGAEGIGLYRTEFAFLNRTEPPGEEEQFKNYRAVANAMGERSVVFRTFDLGADKFNPEDAQDEINPAMGLRAIRLGLKKRSMFKIQLRALLRAAEHGNVQIMFPMISGVGELRQVKALLQETRTELAMLSPSHVPVGCMIELPSAVFIADKLAREADFFSIGTNDLIQYALAIDRVNDNVAYLYTPFHPAVLNAVKTVVDAGARAGIQVAMCGSMAAEPLLIPLLIGMGLRTLSMAPTLIPSVKTMIRNISCVEAEEITRAAFEKDTATEVEDLVRLRMKKRLKI